MARCALLFSYMSSAQRSFSRNLDALLCLHAAGGIYVHDNFTNLGGKIEVTGSWANDAGGAVLRSSSWVFGTILRWL